MNAATPPPPLAARGLQRAPAAPGWGRPAARAARWGAAPRPAGAPPNCAQRRAWPGLCPSPFSGQAAAINQRRGGRCQGGRVPFARHPEGVALTCDPFEPN